MSATEADRFRADELLATSDIDVSFGRGGWQSMVDAIADERARVRAEERRRIVGTLREFADDLYGITGARWIADALTSTLDRLSEGDAP